MGPLGETPLQTPSAVSLLGDQTTYTGNACSATYRWFIDPAARERYLAEDHDTQSRTNVALLRAAVTRDGPDSDAADLADLLRRANEEFAGLWKRHEVGLRFSDTKRWAPTDSPPTSTETAGLRAVLGNGPMAAEESATIVRVDSRQQEGEVRTGSSHGLEGHRATRTCLSVLTLPCRKPATAAVMERAVSGRKLGTTFLMLALGALSIGAGLFLHQRQVAYPDGISTTATISDIAEGRNSEGRPMYTAVYAFTTTDGRKVSFRDSASSSSRPRVGTTVSISYRAADPGGARVVRGWNWFVLSCVIAGGFVLLIGLIRLGVTLQTMLAIRT